jgi:hypothetical protein
MDTWAHEMQQYMKTSFGKPLSDLTPAEADEALQLIQDTAKAHKAGS